MIYKEGQILFCVCPADDQAVVEAKDYITLHNLNADNARMAKRKNENGVESILVILKKDMEI